MNQASGSNDRPEYEDGVARPLRIVTYNIHKGIGGVDRRYRPGRIVDTLLRQDPDIVLLQEVDDLVPRSSCHCQVELLAGELDMSYFAFQRNVQLTRGFYGNAILSRFPLTDIQHLDLTIPLKKRRRALVAHCKLRLDGHQRTLLLVNLHLGLAGFERKMQLNKVLKSEIVEHTHARTPMIIGGDYNDLWATLGKSIMQPAGFESASHHIRTFPAAMPARALDHIYFRGDMALSHAFACRSKVATQASDHLPLIADFWVHAES